MVVFTQSNVNLCRQMQKKRSRKQNIASQNKEAPEDTELDNFPVQHPRKMSAPISGPLRKFSMTGNINNMKTRIQGSFRLISSEGYEEFLRAVGCGPLSLCMVMRAASVVSIEKVRG